MRMRKLGKGQSVVFTVPAEIENKICAMKAGSEDESLTVQDVIVWTIKETWTDTARSAPLWASQGHRFVYQSGLWGEADDEKPLDPSTADKFLEPEAKTLDYRFNPELNEGNKFSDIMTDDDMLQGINDHYRSFGTETTMTQNLNQQQEQQRQQELAPEIQAEVSIERPPQASPALHGLHPKLGDFVRTGELDIQSGAFPLAFDAFGLTTLRPYIETAGSPCGLRVSTDFAHTIRATAKFDYLDKFQREPAWVLTSREEPVNHMLVISPFEADSFIDTIKESDKVSLHIYAPRQNKMHAPIDDLDLYTIPATGRKTIIPPDLRIELNLFAGQLFFRDYKEYVDVANYLGVAWTDKETPGTQVQADGFIKVIDDSSAHPRSRWKESPVMLYKILMSKIRRDCGGIEKTHMGKLLDGILLREEDFEGREKRSAEEISD